jgi:uncharacterized protein YjdB
MAMLFVAFGTMAQSRSASEAMNVASSFLSKQGKASISTSGQRQQDGLSLAYTSKNKLRGTSAKEYFHVFNREGNRGFVIVSADARTKEVLGYADEGTFDTNNLPDNFRAWLEFYEGEIESLDKPSLRATAQTQKELKRPNLRAGAILPAVAPLVKTKWNQKAPYNNNCPTIGSKTPTGCVATAMAQIMKYYNYPVKGTDGNSYTYEINNIPYSYSATFNVEYEWDKMTNYYTTNSTGDGANAVAILMWHCGVAVNMKYTASVSTTGHPTNALRTYFGYDQDMEYARREKYSDVDWSDMIKAELSETRPVYYDGSNVQGQGHAFVCDGYDTNGFFHMNWGWSGSSDGYYELSALNPPSLGTGGGSGGGFNTNQGIILGFKPDDGSTLNKEKIAYNSIAASKQSLTNLNETFNVTLRYISNQGNANFNGQIGFAICGTDNSILHYINIGSYALSSYGSPYYNTLSKNSYKLPALSDGSYRIIPAYTYAATPNDVILMTMNPGGIEYLDITIAGGSVTIGQASQSKPNLTQNSFLATTNLYLNRTGQFTANITNNGTAEYISKLQIVFPVDPPFVIEEAVVIPPGITKDILFSDSIKVPAGNYTVKLMYDKNVPVLNGIYDMVELGTTTAQVNVDPGAPVLSLVSGPTFPNINSVDKNDPQMTVRIKNEGVQYVGNVKVAVFPSSGGTSITTFGDQQIILANGETEVLFNSSINLEPGQYLVRAYYSTGNNTAALGGASTLITLVAPSTPLTLLAATSPYNAQAQAGFSFTNAGGQAVSLTPTTDYTVAYDGRNSTTYSSATPPTNAGDYTATVTLLNTTGYSLAVATVDFSIARRSIGDATLNLGAGPFTYSGAAKTPTATVTVPLGGTTTLTATTDYTLSYANNTAAGTATVTATGAGNYTGTKEQTFTIGKLTLTATGIASDKTYNGTNTASVGLTLTNKVGTDDVSLVATAVFADANVGNGKTVTVQSITLDGADKGNYNAPDPASITGITANITVADYTYTIQATQSIAGGSTTSAIAAPASGTGVTVSGTAETVSGTLEWFTNQERTTPANGYVFQQGTSPTLYWRFTPTNAANYGNVVKEGQVAFTVAAGSPQSLSFPGGSVGKTFGDANFTVTATNSAGSAGGTITYTSGTPAVASVNGATGEVTILKAGSTVITANAAANAVYAAGATSYTLNVSARNISTAVVDISGSYTYNGGAQTPLASDVTVTLGSVLTEGTDYTFALTAGSGTNAGAASITVTGTGNYTGTKTEGFTIDPLQLTATATADGRDYNGTTAAVVTITPTNVIGTDVVTLTGSGTFASANAGTHAVTISNVQLSGASAPNYSAPAPIANPSATITPASYDYPVAPTQAVIDGAGKSAITAAQAAGTGVGSESVAGTLVWYEDAARTIVVGDAFVFLESASPVTLYYRFTASNTNYVSTPKEGSTLFTVTAGAAQDLVFNETLYEVTYGLIGSYNSRKATNNTTNGGSISYSSSDPNVATVSSTGDVTIEGAGQTVITATAAAVPGFFAATSKQYTLKVNRRSLTDEAISVNVGGTYIYNGTLQTPATGDVAVSVGSTALVHGTDYTFALTSGGTDAGSANEITVTGIGNYKETKTGTFAIGKKAISINTGSSIIAAKTYDGSAAASLTSVAFDGTIGTQSLVLGQDYTVTGAAFNSANVADATTVTATIALVADGAISKNYSLADGDFSKTGLSISKATVAGVQQSLMVKAGLQKVYDYPLANLLPSVTGTLGTTGYALSIGTNTDGIFAAGATLSNSPTALSLPVENVADAGKTAVVNVSVSSENYNDFTSTITLTTTNKTLVTISGIAMTGGVYSASPYAYSGTPAFADAVTSQAISDAITLDVLYENTDGATYSSQTAPTDAGNYKLTLSVPATDANYAGNISFNFSITKKPIKVVANDASAVQGTAVPTFTYFIDGQIAGETALNATPLPTLGSPTADINVPGNYPIEVDLNGATPTANYMFDTPATVSGVFTVTSAVIHVTSISLNYQQASLYEGSSLALTATVLPATATNRTVSWSTSNGAVASVNAANGLVSALSAGTAVITATTSNGLTASCTISVMPYSAPLSSDARLYGITISAGSLTPEFRSDVYEYTVEVPHSTTSIIIGATANHSGAGITGAGEKPLIVGTNTFTITVTAEDGSTLIYTLIVKRDTGTSAEQAASETPQLSFDEAYSSMQIRSAATVRTVRIYNFVGMLLIEARPNASGTIFVPINRLASTAYIVRIETEKGVSTFRFVKKL